MGELLRDQIMAVCRLREDLVAIAVNLENAWEGVDDVDPDRVGLEIKALLACNNRLVRIISELYAIIECAERGREIVRDD